MSPIPIAGPAVEPVTLAEAKAHLRLDTADEDLLVEALVATARVTLELTTRRCFIAQTWRARLDSWPPGRRVHLPFAPVLSVAGVRVSPGAGPAVTLDSALYTLRAESEPATLDVVGTAPDPGLPSAGIEIDLVYGYGPDTADVPQPLRLAILRLVARWFERRGDEKDPVLPDDVAALAAPFRRPRLA